MKMETIELTPALERKWVETRSALLWSCPAFTHILFTMLNPSNNSMAALFSREIPVAATDGRNLILNPDTFFNYSLAERVFIVAHEIMHCIYNHCYLSVPMINSKQVKYADGSTLPYEHTLMNVAMDLVINDALIQSRVGTMPQGGLHDTKIATCDDNFLDAYKKVYKNAPKGQSFDQLLPPGTAAGKDKNQAAQEHNQAAWDTAIAGAVAAAKAQGKLPGALGRILEKVLNPEVPWQDIIRAFFARKVGSGGYNWRKPDRRLIQRDIYAPERAGNGCGEIAVAIDTSGSIGQRELDRFFAEMRGILEDVRPSKIYVIWCDAKVHKVDEIEDGADVSGLKPHGGGSTDFRPPFEWVEQNGARLEAMVYLTDGYGSFPDQAPNYPVIWGDIGGTKYPWGDVVKIPLK